MCDTQVFRKAGKTYFAKNSDREPSEAQLVVRIAPVENGKAAKVKTTYIEIGQTAKRFGLILSKPAWLWGAEIGANDQGVVIGNEAVFSKVIEERDGLIGMDLLRLGLERGSSAQEALQVITKLLERYGQGGICGFRDKKFRYDNSFIIADCNEAWILETAQRHWVAKKVDSFGAISNCLTIGSDFDLKSKGLVDFARQKGLFAGGDFHFAKAFDTWFVPFFGSAHRRLAASCTALKNSLDQNRSGVRKAMHNLRLHKHASQSHFVRRNADVCMHAAGYVRRSQTCGSMVSRLTSETAQHFFTGTSAPCLSIFKPVNFDYSYSPGVLSEDGTPPQDSLWQRHEHIHRRVILDSKKRQELQASRDIAEKKMLAFFENYEKQPPATNFQEADRIVMQWQKKWYEHYRTRSFRYAPFNPYKLFWKHLNRIDGFDNNSGR
jgi:secernin